MPKMCVNGSVLRWARETSNISIEEVATRLKKSPEVIQLWENEGECPTYIQLEKLAYEIYKRPLAVFFLPEPPSEPSPEESFRTLPEFEYNKLAPSTIRIIRKGQAMRINLTELCDGRNPSPRNILREISVSTTERPIETSRKLRPFFGISLEEQISWADQETAFNKWRSAIQGAGVFIFKDAFRQNEVSGFCLYDDEFPIIYVNNTLPKTRQTFTLFHELGHLLFRTGGIVKLRDDFIRSLSEKDRRIEIFCNQLAGDFLVPDQDFNEQIKRAPDFGELSITRIAARYCVSREVILRKILDRKLIDSETYEEMVSDWIQQVTEGKEKTSGGNYYANKAVYLGEQYLNLVFGQYYRKRISIRELAEYLDMKTNSVPVLETKLFFTA